MEDMKQQPEGAGRRLYVSREGLGKGISWVDEECNNGRHGGDLVQQLMQRSTISDDFGQSLRARARVNVNLELSRSGNGVRNGFRRPDGRGSGQFAESALDTLYVARNRG